MAGSVLIVGAGPAGAALAYLLARRGVTVTLLEKHRDFARAFRGEGLQPSGINALVQMGLGDKMAQLPQVSVKFIELHRGGRLRTRINTEQLGFAAQFVSQPALLEMLANTCRKMCAFPGLSEASLIGRFVCGHEQVWFPACAELWALGLTSMWKVYDLPYPSGQSTAQGFLPMPQIQPFS